VAIADIVKFSVTIQVRHWTRLVLDVRVFQFLHEISKPKIMQVIVTLQCLGNGSTMMPHLNEIKGASRKRWRLRMG
jgi:hypothetical protein